MNKKFYCPNAMIEGLADYFFGWEQSATEMKFRIHDDGNGGWTNLCHILESLLTGTCDQETDLWQIITELKTGGQPNYDQIHTLIERYTQEVTQTSVPDNFLDTHNSDELILAITIHNRYRFLLDVAESLIVPSHDLGKRILKPMFRIGYHDQLLRGFQKIGEFINERHSTFLHQAC